MAQDATKLTGEDLQLLAARHILDIALDGPELVEAGLALLLAGDESAAVVELAGMRRDDGPVAIRDAFDRVLLGRGLVVNTDEAAAVILARHALARFMADEQCDVMAITTEIASYNHYLPRAPSSRACWRR